MKTANIVNELTVGDERYRVSTVLNGNRSETVVFDNAGR